MQFVEKGDTITLGCDHGGYELCNAIEQYIEAKGINVVRLGCTDGKSVDYPQIAVDVCKQVTDGNSKCGILVCGTGIGMSLAANKVKGIRAALCGDTFSAKFTRLHNDANVLCLGGRVLGEGLALQIVDLFLSTEFEGGRHKRRVDAVMDIEK